MKALWNQIKFQKDLFLMGGAVMLGMFVFGTILHDFLVTGDDEVTSVFCMGTFMATIVMFMMMFFFAGVHMVQIFNYAVAMGQTRKRTFPMYTIAVFGTFFSLSILLKVMNELEKWRLKLMFPGLKIEQFVDVILNFRYLLAFALVGTAFSVLLGAGISRFGKAAFWVWWVLLMTTCIGGPRLIHYMTGNHPDSGLIVFAEQTMENIVAHAQVISVVAVRLSTVIFIGAGYLIVRRQQVNV